MESAEDTNADLSCINKYKVALTSNIEIQNYKERRISPKRTELIMK